MKFETISEYEILKHAYYHIMDKWLKRIERFQSTSPVWRTTDFMSDFGYYVNVSIHVPRVEDDREQKQLPQK